MPASTSKGFITTNVLSGKAETPVQVGSLPILTRVLGVSLEELMGEAKRPAKRGPASKLERQLERLAALPKSQQKVVSKMLEGVLQQAGR